MLTCNLPACQLSAYKSRDKTSIFMRSYIHDNIKLLIKTVILHPREHIWLNSYVKPDKHVPINILIVLWFYLKCPVWKHDIKIPSPIIL